MKKIFLILLLCLFLVVIFLLLKTFTYSSLPTSIELPPSGQLHLDSLQTPQRLAMALQFETISCRDSANAKRAAFLDFQQFLQTAFPRVHSVLQKEIVNDLSLLFTWPGTNPAQKPILLMAHQDVVPVESATLSAWHHPPFAGHIADGYIWGRGALDIKSGLMAILEAVEALLAEDFQPTQTIFLAFGHDEEIGGLNGAVQIVRRLKQRNVALELVLDEGGFIVNGVIPGLRQPVAIIGIAEKGYVSLKLQSQVPGGHSSMPPHQTAIGQLCQAITHLEENPFPANLKIMDRFFRHIAPAMPFLQRMVFANLWLTSPLVEAQLSQSPTLNAAIRTTTAVTMFSGGINDNVLPLQATAIVNFRVLPGDSIQGVENFVRETIDNPRIKISLVDSGSNPSPIAEINSSGYQILSVTIAQLMRDQDIIIAPYLVIAATDSRHYTEIAQNVFRFIPIRLMPEDVNRIHGINERISQDNYLEVINFYYQLIKNCAEIYTP